MRKLDTIELRKIDAGDSGFWDNLSSRLANSVKSVDFSLASGTVYLGLGGGNLKLAICFNPFDPSVKLLNNGEEVYSLETLINFIKAWKSYLPKPF